jgi:hypothetical protein
MSDREVSEERHTDAGVPDEPPPDDFEWTSEPDDPDAAGMPGEFVNEPHDGVPGVRTTEDPPA